MAVNRWILSPGCLPIPPTRQIYFRGSGSTPAPRPYARKRKLSLLIEQHCVSSPLQPHNYGLTLNLVRLRGLEPPSLTGYAPQAYVYTIPPQPQNYFLKFKISLRSFSNPCISLTRMYPIFNGRCVPSGIIAYIPIGRSRRVQKGLLPSCQTDSPSSYSTLISNEGAGSPLVRLLVSVPIWT